MAVFDVQRVLATLQKLEKQTAALSQSMSQIETSIATAPVLTGLTPNIAALPSAGDFSNTPYSADVDYLGDVDGPDINNSFVVSNTVVEANTIASYGIPIGNTTEYHLTLIVPDGVDTPITFWMSTKPGANSIVQNAYVTDRAQAVNISSNTVIKFKIGTTGLLIGNDIYTHSYLLDDKTYYMNFTYNTVGNFSGRKMAPDFEVPPGIFETALTITGLKVL